MDTTLETFEIGNGIGDIGGEEIDLRSLDLTNTLIGSCYNELTQALGEPTENPFEAYHLNDGGIADIELTAFDSAIIRDSGIADFRNDPNAGFDEDADVAELAEIVGKKKTKVTSKVEPKVEGAAEPPKAFVEWVGKCLAEVNMSSSEFDKFAINFANDDRYPWLEQEVAFDKNGICPAEDDDEIVVTNEDFKDAEAAFVDSEFEALVDDIIDGKFEAAFAPPEFKVVA